MLFEMASSQLGLLSFDRAEEDKKSHNTLGLTLLLTLERVTSLRTAVRIPYFIFSRKEYLRRTSLKKLQDSSKETFKGSDGRLESSLGNC